MNDRSLARAVWAQKAEYFTRKDIERNFINGLQLAEDFCQSLDFYNWFNHSLQDNLNHV
jgi:hypothetical protein